MSFVFVPEISWGDILTAASLIVAIILGVLGYLSARDRAVRSHTLDLLAMISNNDKLAESDFKMTRLINSKIWLNDELMDDETDRYIINLLDFYEFLATSCKWGTVDEDILMHVRGGAMSRAYSVCEHYILDRRKSLDAPNLYRNWENFVSKYREKQLGL